LVLPPLTAPLSPHFLSPALPPTAISTLSLHDALPISCRRDPPIPRASPTARSPPTRRRRGGHPTPCTCSCRTCRRRASSTRARTDRKSTRLNSSHQIISYAVFCLKKTKNKRQPRQSTA